MDENLRRVFEQTRPSPEQKEAMLCRLLESERKVVPMKKLKKLTVLGIAAALMAVCCAAAVVTGIDQQILEYFHIASEQEPLMSPAAVRIEKSHTYTDGWTVNIRQALSDRYTMAVLFDVTAPEGVCLDGRDSYLYINSEAPEHGGSGQSSYYLEDETREENRASYLFVLNYDSDKADILGSTWKLIPKRFLCTEQDGTSYEVALGDWTCTVALSEQDPGILYEVGESVQLKGYEATLDQLYLSPISFAFRLRHIPSPLWDGEFGLVSEDWEGKIILHKGSGGTVEMEELPLMGGMSNPDPDDPDAAYGHFQFRPAELIDPIEIVSVTICGQTYELK